jgi:hypothetical protein
MTRLRLLLFRAASVAVNALHGAVQYSTVYCIDELLYVR